LKEVDIQGFEDSYYINDSGEVYSKSRIIGRRCIKGRKMALVPNSSGYYQVTLNLNSTRKKFYIHRLLYIHFVGDIPKGYEIDHIDSNKSNNAIDNLRLVTRKENMEKCLQENPHIMYNLKNQTPKAISSRAL